MSRLQDHTGRTVKCLTFVRFVRLSNHKKAIWLARCVCGKEKEVIAANVIHGTTVGCGCAVKSHGMSHTAEYKVWDSMIQRCCNANSPAYRNYGARGIYVVQRWRGSFSNFIKDMGKRPTPNHTLERVKNNWHYGPFNCVWATRKQQCNNYRANVFYEFRGIKRTVTQWAEDNGIKPETLRQRLAHGWKFKKAIETPVDTSKHNKIYAKQ